MSSKYEFIDGEKANYPIVKMCRWAKVSKSGFYEWRDRPASATTERRAALTTHVHRVFADADGAAGYRRVHAQLDREGIEAGPELVRQIMAAEELVACQPRPFRTTTISDVAPPGRRTCATVTSPRRRRASSGSRTSPICGRGPGGCTWPR